MADNNYWHHFDPEAQCTLVFVHGFLSNSTKSWTSSHKVFWPDLVLQDSRVGKSSVFLGGYHTAVNAGDYGIPDCADELHSALCRASSNGKPAAANTGALIFVCHSMGGIVVRYMLEKYPGTFSQKNIGLCLIASPSLGSRWANLASLASNILKSRAASQLQFFSSFLSELDDRFMIYLDGRRDARFYGAEATESRALISFGGLFNPIVRKYSSARYFSSRRTLANTDHSSIVKPDNVDAPGHEFLVDFLANCGFYVPGQGKQNDLVRPLVPLDVLFNAYELRLEPFYLERQMDRDLQEVGGHMNIWLSGPPGVGKTCALKRYTIRAAAVSYQICLAQCGSNPSRERLAREIYESLAEPIAKNDISDDGIYSATVRLLTSRHKDSICIYIDEVGAAGGAEGCAMTLLSLLVDLQAAYQQTSEGRLQFVVSSLLRPDISGFSQRGKLLEFFAFMECGVWGSEQLNELMSIIDAQLSIGQSSGVDTSMVLASGNGTPRFLKSLIRKIVFESSGACFSLDDAAREVSEQIIG